MDESLGSNPVQYIEQLFTLTQLITSPTRETPTTATTLDVILASHTEKHTKSGVILCGLSEHRFIYAIIRNKDRPKIAKMITLRDYNKFNQVNFMRDLAQAIDSLQDTNNLSIHEYWSARKTKIDTVSNVHAPIRTRCLKSRNNPWITKEMIEVMYK